MEDVLVLKDHEFVNLSSLLQPELVHKPQTLRTHPPGPIPKQPTIHPRHDLIHFLPKEGKPSNTQ